MGTPLFSPAAFSQPILAALNHVLGQADWAKQRLRPHAGRAVRIAMTPFSFTCAIDAEGLLRSSSSTPDLDIALPANTPLLALQGNDAVTKAARIEGPADLADAISFVLRHLRWDIEEDLSKLLGDVAARRVVQGMTGFMDWQRESARRLGDNIGEYLTHENAAFVPKADFDALAQDIERLCSRLSLIETRVQRMKEKNP